MARLSCIGGASGVRLTHTIGAGDRTRRRLPAALERGRRAGSLGPSHPTPTERNPMQRQDEHRSPRRQVERDPPQGRPSSAGWPSWSSRSRSAAPSGSKQLTDAEAVSGEAGRAEVALEERQAEPERARSCSSRARADTVDEPAVRGRGRRSDPQPGGGAVGPRRSSSPADGGGQVSADGHSALVEFEIPGDEEAGRSKGRRQPRRDRRGATGANPDVAGRAVRRRQRQQGAGRGLQRRPGEGGDDLAAGHPADPARARLRRPGRGPGAAADRLLGGAGDDSACWRCPASWCRWTPTSPRSWSWSGSRSASTTRSSTCAASAKSDGRGARRRPRWQPRRRPRAGRCWSPA